MENKSIEYPKQGQYTINDLLAIMEILRSENGCPWDREQTHQSVRNAMLEEAYEAVEAIDLDDKEMLTEELGDVLFQVVFHAQIGKEQGRFDFDIVCDEICRKMIVRHPHVFSALQADTVETVLNNWDAIKQQTKGRTKEGQALDGVCRTLPSLMRAQKLAKRALKADIPLQGEADPVSKAIEEAMQGMSTEEKQKYFGEALFRMAKTAHENDIDAEEALYRTCESFVDDHINA